MHGDAVSPVRDKISRNQLFYLVAIKIWFARIRPSVAVLGVLVVAIVIGHTAWRKWTAWRKLIHSCSASIVMSYEDRLLDFTRDYAGHPDGEQAIGENYLNCRGTERDGELASIWLSRAAHHGFVPAFWDWKTESRRRRLISQYHLASTEPRMVEPASAAPGKQIIDCASCPTMIVLPRGKFVMGGNSEETGHVQAEEPRHLVYVLKTIAVSQTPITFSQWDACVVAGPCRKDLDDMGWGRGNRPAINVTWNDLSSYIDWLNATTKGGYRLLSEAEWEFAARAGSESAYWWGDAMKPGYAHCLDCNPTVPKSTAPVASYEPNPFGLYDMAGNVWQWVADCPGNAFDATGPNYRSAPATSVPWMGGDDNNCNIRVLRGGAWDYDSSFARASQRNWMVSVIPAASDANVGFRIALVLGNVE